MRFYKRGIATVMMAVCMTLMTPVATMAAVTDTQQTTTTTTTTTTNTTTTTTQPSDSTQTQTVVPATNYITTPVSSLPANSNKNMLSVMINSSKGKRRYRIFNQKAKGRDTYVNLHGCAVCTLTTVLSGFTKKYANYTPEKTYKTLEKNVFGKKNWKKNYSKGKTSKRPVSLYGISRVLKKVGVKNSYIKKFKYASAITSIKNHLRKGNPVIIEVNCHTQVNGKFSKVYTNKWARTKHTMVLLGMTDTGKVIVADSTNRGWSGVNQRIKYTTMEDIARYMISCSSSSNSYYYTNMASCGGFILIN